MDKDRVAAARQVKGSVTEAVGWVTGSRSNHGALELEPIRRDRTCGPR